ncbi:hypothetical protein R6Z07M_011261 [Ovis aries]
MKQMKATCVNGCRKTMMPSTGNGEIEPRSLSLSLPLPPPIPRAFCGRLGAFPQGRGPGRPPARVMSTGEGLALAVLNIHRFSENQPKAKGGWSTAAGMIRRVCRRGDAPGGRVIKEAGPRATAGPPQPHSLSRSPWQNALLSSYKSRPGRHGHGASPRMQGLPETQPWRGSGCGGLGGPPLPRPLRSDDAPPLPPWIWLPGSGTFSVCRARPEPRKRTASQPRRPALFLCLPVI